MRRAEKSKLNRTAVVLAVGIVVVGMLLVWRETGNQNRLDGMEAREQSLTEQLARTTSDLTLQEERSSQVENELSEAAINRQTLEDRITNLEAQRDHLRTENERQSRRAVNAESSLAAMENGMEDLRHQVLQKESLPRELRNQLTLATDRIADLETQLDRETGLQLRMPPHLEVDGVSTDGGAFALAGDLPDSLQLPLSIYLCQSDGVLLEGWVHRKEGSAYIGHTERWAPGVSTLVKGEKVFILPRNIYEADH